MFGPLLGGGKKESMTVRMKWKKEYQETCGPRVSVFPYTPRTHRLTYYILYLTVFELYDHHYGVSVVCLFILDGLQHLSWYSFFTVVQFFCVLYVMLVFCRCSAFESEVKRLRIFKKVRVCEECYKNLKQRT